MNSVESYFVCATPRTGSSLLLGLLESTGVAGRPQAYFREPDEPLWADRWQVAREPDLDYAAYVRGALIAGRGDNGVFGAKLMWGTHEHLLARLGTVHPALADRPLALLRRVFGPVAFVHLRRGDALAQAVSWVRAEQTGTWYLGGHGEIGGPGAATAVPVFDADRIATCLATIAEHEAGWERWFAAHDVQPLSLDYEDLVRDMGGAVQGVLAFLGIEPAAGHTPAPRHHRQADHVSEEWIDRYRALRGPDR